MDLNYIRKVNGMYGKNSVMDSEISEIVNDYNEAKENLITKFRVAINSNDAVEVRTNNDTEYKKALIYNSSNKPNRLNEYEKLIQMEKNIIKTGTYIYTKEDKFPYLVVSAIDKEHDYEEAKIKSCNVNLKIKDKEGNIVSIPVYYENQTMYNIGIKKSETSQINMGDTIVKVYMNAEIGRKYIYRGMRILIMVNGRPTPYEATYLDTSQEGMLIFQTSEDKLNEEDDIENMVAHNYKENNSLPIPTNAIYIDGVDPLSKSATYDIHSNSTNYNLATKNSLDFEFSVDRPDFARVEKVDDKTCILYGLKAREYVVLTAKCGDIELKKDILIKDIEVMK